MRTQVRIFKSCNLCPDSSLYHVLFYCSIPDLFLGSFKNDRAGIYCRSVRNYSFLSAPTCPFRRLPPPPSPTSGDGFFNVNHLIIFAFSYIKNINSFFLSRSLPPNTEGSAEPCEAIGASLRTQVRIFKSCNLCPDSSLYPILFYFSIPDRFLRPFKNDRQIFTIVL